ncbi:D-alanyl-D-alanine carboxypeptidase [Clostridia bacterium]|nr:D-alanyl-D-alanine carboxypeptidase [Clostridia bacterium]
MFSQKKTRKCFFIFAAVIMLVVQGFVFTVSALPEPPEQSLPKLVKDGKDKGLSPENVAFGAYLVNLNTNTVVYEYNKDRRLSPASTTKIMTCFVVLENIKDLDEKVVVNRYCMDEFYRNPDPNKNGPSSADLQAGQDNLTYKDCLYAMMLPSACEAANILAYNVGKKAGGQSLPDEDAIPNFINMMNDTAARLGCVNTHFGNAHGLYQKDNYSTPYEMYLITRYAKDNYPLFMEICDTKEYTLPANANNPAPYTVRSTNSLLTKWAGNPFTYEFAHGVKTGSIGQWYDVDTKEWHDGFSCLVSTASKEGLDYMLVVLQSPYYDDKHERYLFSFEDTRELYRWAFKSFSIQKVVTADEVATEAKVLQGLDADHVQLFPASEFSTLLQRTFDKSMIEKKFFAQDGTPLSEAKFFAPIKKGDVLGTMKLMYENRELASVKLVAGDDIELSKMERFKSVALGIVSQTWFIAGAVLLAVMITAAVVLGVIHKKQAKKRKW